MNPLFGIVNRELVGIIFSGDSLKLTHARISPNRREVLDILSHNIGGLSDEDIVKTIRKSLSELKPKNPDIIDIIPPNLVITKNIEIPSTKPQEIKNIIDLQAGRHTPYSREEIIVDYIDIGPYRHSYTKILLIIVARNVIRRQFEILGKAGVRLQKVAFSSEGLARFVSKVSRIEAKESPISVMDIDESLSDFTIIFKDKPIFVRSIPIGTQHLISEKERYQLKFVEEIKRSLEAYQSEDIEKSPNMLILTGAIEEVKDLQAVLNDNLHLPTRTVSYFKNLIVSSRALKATSAAKGSSFLSAIVPLFVLDELKVDLIPEEVKLRKSVEEKGRELIKTGIFILTIFVLIFSILLSKIYFKGNYLNMLNKEYQSLNQKAQELETDFAKISLVKNYLSNRGYSLEILTNLHEVAPFDLKLSDIRFEGEGKFTIKGTAESMSTVFSFVDSLENSKYFQDVKTRYTTKRKDGLKDVTDFEIVSTLTK